jgi:aspartate kinase
MKKPVNVFKFGGASIKDATSMKNVANILLQYKGDPIVIVVSALGKTTNALEVVIKAHQEGSDQTMALYGAIKETHFQLLHELLDKENEAFKDLNDIFVEAEWALEEAPHPNYDYIYDQIVSVGELASSVILSAYLNSRGLPTKWMDARDMLKTDEIYREATVNWSETIDLVREKMLPVLNNGSFILTQGFIGSTNENATTTLGREGSDYSAAIFSYCLDAEKMTIWKDVPGVLTADPRLFENVQQLYRLSYNEAIEMTYYGARVIHPKTIKPLQNKSIPLHVKSFIQPEAKGTVISADVEDNYPPIVVVESGQALLIISTKDFSFVAEHHLGQIFNLSAKHRVWVNLMKNTAINFIACVPNDTGRVDAFIEDLQKDFNVVKEENLELVTVRHYQEDLLNELKKGKIILLEDSFEKTVQMVLKTVPMLKRKDV